MFMQNVNHLKAAGLWLNVEEDERRLLQAGIDQIGAQQRIDAGWLAESIACLLWALKIIPEMPSYDQEASLELVNAPYEFHQGPHQASPFTSPRGDQDAEEHRGALALAGADTTAAGGRALISIARWLHD
jgi:hypothetical protein